MTAPQRSITAVSGLTVGHHTDRDGGTGCTVILGPVGGMRAAVFVRGRATGTRELDALDPRHLVGHVDAILFTGGSAYGLGAADGVMRWLAARSRGLPVHPIGVVPIVPAAVVFDLGNVAGGPGGPPRWPGPADGERACEAASTDVAEGSVGAGTGATVGKARGLAGAMKAGVGTWAAREGEVVVGVLVVVNAFGDVRDAKGEILAGARDGRGRFVDALRYLAAGGPPFGALAQAAKNTTLAVVATNAALDKVQLQALAQAASDALARRITPYGTAYDGDVVFAVSTAAVAPLSPLQAEALVAEVVPEAVERAVRLAHGNAKVPGLADRTGTR